MLRAKLAAFLLRLGHRLNAGVLKQSLEPVAAGQPEAAMDTLSTPPPTAKAGPPAAWLAAIRDQAPEMYARYVEDASVEQSSADDLPMAPAPAAPTTVTSAPTVRAKRPVEPLDDQPAAIEPRSPWVGGPRRLVSKARALIGMVSSQTESPPPAERVPVAVDADLLADLVADLDADLDADIVAGYSAQRLVPRRKVASENLSPAATASAPAQHPNEPAQNAETQLAKARPEPQRGSLPERNAWADRPAESLADVIAPADRTARAVRTEQLAPPALDAVPSDQAAQSTPVRRLPPQVRTEEPASAEPVNAAASLLTAPAQSAKRPTSTVEAANRSDCFRPQPPLETIVPPAPTPGSAPIPAAIAEPACRRLPAEPVAAPAAMISPAAEQRLWRTESPSPEHLRPGSALDFDAANLWPALPDETPAAAPGDQRLWPSLRPIDPLPTQGNSIPADAVRRQRLRAEQRGERWNG